MNGYRTKQTNQASQISISTQISIIKCALCHDMIKLLCFIIRVFNPPSTLVPDLFGFCYGHLDDSRPKRGKISSSAAIVPVSSVYSPTTLTPVQQFFADMEWTVTQGKRAKFTPQTFESVRLKFLHILYAFLVNANELISRWAQYSTYIRDPPPLWDFLWDRTSVLTVVLQFAASMLSPTCASAACNILVRMQVCLKSRQGDLR